MVTNATNILLCSSGASSPLKPACTTNQELCQMVQIVFLPSPKPDCFHKAGATFGGTQTLFTPKQAICYNLAIT